MNNMEISCCYLLWGTIRVFMWTEWGNKHSLLIKANSQQKFDNETSWTWSRVPTAVSRLWVKCYYGEMQISHSENGERRLLRNADTHFLNYTSYIPDDRRCNIY